MRDGRGGEVSFSFTTQYQVGHGELRRDVRTVQRSRAGGVKLGKAANRDLAGLQPVNAGQFEAATVNTELKLPGISVEAAIAGYAPAVLLQDRVAKPDLFSIEIEVRENGVVIFAVDGSLQRLQMTLAAQGISRSRNGHAASDEACDVISGAQRSLRISDVDIFNCDTRAHGRVSFHISVYHGNAHVTADALPSTT